MFLINYGKNFWRVRLGAAKKGHNRYERVYNLCKKEKTPCIVVGWGEIDFSQDIDEIIRERYYEENYVENRIYIGLSHI